MTATLPSLALLDDCGRRPYRGRSRVTPSSPSIMAWMKPRTRSRTTASIGSNQSSKRYTAVSSTGCEESCFVVMLFMAWSPIRRFYAGLFEVEHPGDYATFNSNHLRDSTTMATEIGLTQEAIFSKC